MADIRMIGLKQDAIATKTNIDIWLAKAHLATNSGSFEEAKSCIANAEGQRKHLTDVHVAIVSLHKELENDNNS